MAPDGQLRSKNRKALLGMYAALDTSGKVRDVLDQLGVEFDAPLDPAEQLRKAAADLNRQDRSDPPIPRLYVARALTDLLHHRGASDTDTSTDTSFDQLGVVVEQLVDPDRVAGRRAAFELFELFRKASSATLFEDRWAQINPIDQNFSNHKDLRVFEAPRISTSLRAVGGEIATRIETNFVVNLEGEEPDLLAIAPALLPYNWPVCGDFFCDLSRAEDRDGDVEATGGELLPDTSHWCGVYLERVGVCPDGWFPDTFLKFTWDRYQDQLILRYQLAPRRGNDGTVLKIDEGYIQVNRLHRGFQVSTLKYLLFDHRFLPSGGQIAAALAPEFGWLDYSINQFGTCELKNLPPHSIAGTPSPGAPGREGIDAGFQRILDLAKAQLQDSATSADAQFGRVMSKVKEGKYGLNDFVGDWGEAALRAMRDTSRVALNGISLAEESLELAKAVVGKKGKRS